MNADETRVMIRREYTDVYTTLRKLLNVPSDEMVLSFEWDKKEGLLRLITLKDTGTPIPTNQNKGDRK